MQIRSKVSPTSAPLAPSGQEKAGQGRVGRTLEEDEEERSGRRRRGVDR